MKIYRLDKLRRMAWRLAVTFAMIAALPALGDCQVTQPTGAAPAARAMPRLIPTREACFAIPFRMSAPVDGQQPVSVRLLVSRDQGKQWWSYASSQPNQKQFVFKSIGDGEYWFRLLTIDQAGRVFGDDGGVPGLRVLVDTQAPTMEFSASQASNGKLEAEWELKESHADPSGFVIWYRFDAMGEWRQAPVDWEKALTDAKDSKETLAAGESVWWPEEGAQFVEIRAEAVDLAGNQQVAHTRVTLDPSIQIDPDSDAIGSSRATSGYSGYGSRYGSYDDEEEDDDSYGYSSGSGSYHSSSGSGYGSTYDSGSSSYNSNSGSTYNSGSSGSNYGSSGSGSNYGSSSRSGSTYDSGSGYGSDSSDTRSGYGSGTSNYGSGTSNYGSNSGSGSDYSSGSNSYSNNYSRSGDSGYGSSEDDSYSNGSGYDDGSSHEDDYGYGGYDDEDDSYSGYGSDNYSSGSNYRSGSNSGSYSDSGGASTNRYSSDSQSGQYGDDSYGDEYGRNEYESDSYDNGSDGGYGSGYNSGSGYSGGSNGGSGSQYGGSSYNGTNGYGTSGYGSNGSSSYDSSGNRYGDDSSEYGGSNSRSGDGRLSSSPSYWNSNDGEQSSSANRSGTSNGYGRSEYNNSNGYGSDDEYGYNEDSYNEDEYEDEYDGGGYSSSGYRTSSRPASVAQPYGSSAHYGGSSTGSRVELRSATLTRNAGEPQVLIEWETGGYAHRDARITLSYSTSTYGPWKPIVGGIRNSGRYVWPYAPGIGSSVYIQIESEDASGDTTKHRLPSSVYLSSN